MDKEILKKEVSYFLQKKKKEFKLLLKDFLFSKKSKKTICFAIANIVEEYIPHYILTSDLYHLIDDDVDIIKRERLIELTAPLLHKMITKEIYLLFLDSAKILKEFINGVIDDPYEEKFFSSDIVKKTIEEINNNYYKTN